MKISPTRRQFTCGLGAGVVAASGLASWPAMATEAHNFNMGSTKITILSDGSLSLPAQFMLPGFDAAARKAFLTPLGLDTESFRPDCNITLVQKGDRLVLFDVGAGPNFQTSAGELGANLEAAGIDPGAVTDVVLTHAHPDHIWGVVDDFDDLVFSEAQYWISRTEWDFWRAEDTLAKIGEARTTFVIGARNRFDFIEDRLQLFSPGKEIIPGIEAIDTAGHTPGHCSFMVRDGSEEALIVGDAIGNNVISFARPDLHWGADQDMGTGARTRVSLLDRAVADKVKVIGFHLPFPGVGQAERDGNAYRFVAST